MGVAGVEGIFRRCCEETLKVLRSSADVLSTILEVFIHDPLLRWNISPAKGVPTFLLFRPERGEARQAVAFPNLFPCVDNRGFLAFGFLTFTLSSLSVFLALSLPPSLPEPTEPQPATSKARTAATTRRAATRSRTRTLMRTRCSTASNRNCAAWSPASL